MMSMASRSFVEQSVLNFAQVVVIVAMCTDAADPDPLQDFYVADLMSWTRVNEYPCRKPTKVCNEDFMYHGLRHSGDTATQLDAPITKAHVQNWPTLNTQGFSWASIDFAPDGLKMLHWHPRAFKIFYQESTIQVMYV